MTTLRAGLSLALICVSLAFAWLAEKVAPACWKQKEAARDYDAEARALLAAAHRSYGEAIYEAPLTEREADDMQRGVVSLFGDHTEAKA